MKWIPVTEKLPTESDCNKRGYVMSYLRPDRQWGWPTKFGFSKWNRVNSRTHTHWMPLPPIPEASLPSSSVTGEEDEDEIYEIEDIDTIREMAIKSKRSSKWWCKKAMEAANDRIQLQQTIKELSATGESEAIGLAEWTAWNGWIKILKTNSKEWIHTTGTLSTTAELYNLYKQSKK